MAFIPGENGVHIKHLFLREKKMTRLKNCNTDMHKKDMSDSSSSVKSEHSSVDVK
jgi:hypothetical protein